MHIKRIEIKPVVIVVDFKASDLQPVLCCEPRRTDDYNFDDCTGELILRVEHGMKVLSHTMVEAMAEAMPDSPRYHDRKEPMQWMESPIGVRRYDGDGCSEFVFHDRTGDDEHMLWMPEDQKYRFVIMGYVE